MQTGHDDGPGQQLGSLLHVSHIIARKFTKVLHKTVQQYIARAIKLFLLRKTTCINFKRKITHVFNRLSIFTLVRIE